MSVQELDPHAEAKAWVVDLLRDLLARAERGELKSVHVCAVLVDDGTMQLESAGGYSVFEVVAGLEMTKLRIIADSKD